MYFLTQGIVSKMKKIDKHYVSEIDKKMAEFDASHAKSPEQKAEIKKYQWIHQHRDIAIDSAADKDGLWESH